MAISNTKLGKKIRETIEEGVINDMRDSLKNSELIDLCLISECVSECVNELLRTDKDVKQAIKAKILSLLTIKEDSNGNNS